MHAPEVIEVIDLSFVNAAHTYRNTTAHHHGRSIHHTHTHKVIGSIGGSAIAEITAKNAHISNLKLSNFHYSLLVSRSSPVRLMRSFVRIRSYSVCQVQIWLYSTRIPNWEVGGKRAAKKLNRNTSNYSLQTAE